MSSFNYSADALRDRFKVEQGYVQKHVDLLQRRTIFHAAAVKGIVHSLEKYGLASTDELLERPSGFHLSFIIDGQIYNDPRLEKFYNKLQRLKPKTEEALKEAEARLCSLEYSEHPLSSKVRSLVIECIDHLTDVLTHDATPEQTQQACGRVISNLRESEIYEDAPIYIGDDFGSYEQLVDYSVKRAKYIIQEEKVYALTTVLESIEDLDIIVRMSRGDAEINVLRQGFITLSTVFDATVFDLMRIALERDFFNLIALFGRQDKVSLERISRYSSFEELRGAIIEEQLKSKYLREIMFILQGHKVMLTDISEGDEFIHLLEMVLRRNIHIHNRGIVDSKYLETNENGVPRYNVYNLAPGTVAHIDYEYWKRANRLSLNCVNLITDWVNNLT